MGTTMTINPLSVAALVLWIGLAVPPLSAQQRAAVALSPQLSVDQIVDTLVSRNAERATALRSFHSTRRYELNYHGFPASKYGKMVVDAQYDAPDSKQFKIVSEEGSWLILDRVLHKLLESEQEAMTPENRDHVGLTRNNYSFQLVGTESRLTGMTYVLQVEPKTHNKFLYRGRIWVDAHDFAVVRIMAEPAKNPSFWIKRSDIEHTYRKVGEFWLPEQNHTITQVRLGGHSELTIAYDDYKITDARPLPHDAARTAALAATTSPAGR